MPSVVVSIEPASEPLTLNEVKTRLRVSGTDGDADITALIVAARREAENYTRSKFITQTLIKYYDDFPGEIGLEYPPISSVSNIKYYDFGGVLQTLSASVYQTDLVSVPSRIRPVFGQIWPIISPDKYNAVQITYVCGYGSSGASVPEDIKNALYMMISYWYENRETAIDRTITEIPFGSRCLLDYYRDKNAYYIY